MPKTVQDVLNAVDSNVLLSRSLSDWRPILANDCQVYVFGESYLGKRFDQIHYKFCEKNEAKEILIDNLYALLRFKYFPSSTEEIDDRINKIVSSFTANLKTTLKKVSFDKESDSTVVKMLPDYCLAFRNGVYNFKDGKWLFKYDVTKLDKLSNWIYSYSPEYIILWYMDYVFTPLDFSILDMPLEEFIQFMKDLTSTNRNYCFELLYNISHDETNKFSLDRFVHLCEILGYTTLQSFSEFFVMLIGSGQNGKNSLFDGCFTNRVVPRPSSNDLDAIENDRFITGTLENKAHNIFLETSAKTYTESKMIKALTGSMYQTIEQKGVNKYSGVINCKYVFAGNDQDKIKFSDTTTGFRRRINMFEIWYTWDSAKRFLKKGDYYDTTFSDSLNELKNDVLNSTVYVYFAMYGIAHGTDNFTKNFQFTKNDWNYKYSDVDLSIKDKIESITTDSIAKYIDSNAQNREEGKTMFFDMDRKRLYLSETMENLGYHGFNDMLKMLSTEDESIAYFTEHDVYISLRSIQSILKDISSSTAFTQQVKKMFSISSFESFANKPYIKCTFRNNKLKIIL